MCLRPQFCTCKAVLGRGNLGYEMNCMTHAPGAGFKIPHALLYSYILLYTVCVTYIKLVFGKGSDEKYISVWQEVPCLISVIMSGHDLHTKHRQFRGKRI